MKKLLLLFVFIPFFISGCGSINRPTFSVGLQTTDLGNTNTVTEAEYANTFKVDTKRVDVKAKYSRFHVAYRYENIRSNGRDEVPSLINTDHNWIGVGVHTKLGSSITYYRDLSHKLWMIGLDGKYKIKPYLSIIGGIYHLDKNGGTLFKGAGRRTTGIKVGLSYAITPRIDINAAYESGNNGRATIEDRLMTGFEYKF